MMKPLCKLAAPILLLLFAMSCDTTSTNSDDPEEIHYSETENPGMSNLDFLTNETFNRLILEIDYMPGMRPTDAAIDSLEEFLAKWLQKTEIIIQVPTEIPSGGQEEYSADDIRDLEAEHRDTRTDVEEGTLTSYNIFVDGSYDSGNVLGIAYYNTSNAYFGETIHNVSGSPPLNPSREKVEATVLRHEYGHLLGLVNNGTEMQSSHQDSGNGRHCTEENCLMYYAVETTDFFANLFDGSIPELDAYCESDVRAAQD
ncbi:MAG: hypothetical protein WD355_07645 [Balneolaceae bacterium]